MTWITTRNDASVREAVALGSNGYPVEYGPERRPEMRVAPEVASDDIMLAHSLIPGALEHMFAGYAAMIDPALPLRRRDHELIAAVVSSLNRCHF